MHAIRSQTHGRIYFCSYPVATTIYRSQLTRRSTKFNTVSFYHFESQLHTAAIVKLEKNGKRTNRTKKAREQIWNEKDVYDIYQPLIDKVIYIDDQLISLSQLISRFKTSEDVPLDSASVLNLAEYITNMSRTVFKDVNILLNEIFYFDLNSARKHKLEPRS